MSQTKKKNPAFSKRAGKIIRNWLPNQTTKAADVIKPSHHSGPALKFSTIKKFPNHKLNEALNALSVYSITMKWINLRSSSSEKRSTSWKLFWTYLKKPPKKQKTLSCAFGVAVTVPCRWSPFDRKNPEPAWTSKYNLSRSLPPSHHPPISAWTRKTIPLRAETVAPDKQPNLFWTMIKGKGNGRD